VYVEIEIDTPRNGSLWFRPLQRQLRGRFDFNRVAEPMARVAPFEHKVPEVFPGLHVALDTEALAAAVIEPLHGPDHQEVRAKLKARGWGLGNEREEIEVKAEALPTWLYWLKRAVEGGTARLVKGKLPDKVEGKVQRTWVHNEPKPDKRDSLINKLVAILYSELPEAKRQKVDAILASEE
jgi:hypothetical protein